MSVSRDAVIAEAQTWIGTPFVFGSSVKGVGVDCSKFALAVFYNVGAIPKIEATSPPASYCLRKNNPSVILKFLGDHPNIVTSIGQDVASIKPCDIIAMYEGAIVHHIAIVAEDSECVYMCDRHEGVIKTSMLSRRVVLRKFHSIWRVRGVE